VPAILVILVARGCLAERGPMQALELGTGISRNATVEARIDAGPWQTCDYHRLEGTHVCDGMLVAYDSMTSLLNDAPPSWAFNTAGIHASAETIGVEMRVRFEERLDGTYWAATNGEGVVLEVAGEDTRLVDRTIVTYADAGRRAIELRAYIPTTTWMFTMVREDTILPDREFLVRPPPAPPPLW
jgi:hypothetical protein